MTSWAAPQELPGDGWATTRTGAAGPDLDGEAAFADWLDKATRGAEPGRLRPNLPG